ncbi:MAG: Peptidase M23/M37 [Candidatus Collierbacteria bacterium GW2011_GWB1_45_35]|nr:MAG: Peptidase M23/M37 [Microgenomates group bacterium GW2011_GWC1_44_23]KKU05709.1 MAG: Peptidase M23/M37 [Candidatus Collierbacteria bacterium GW2011_GWB1_45_35]
MSVTKTGYGRSVVLDHGNGLQTRYAHMGKIFVEEGERVTPAMPVGEVGITGKTTGPHLHLEVIKKNRTVNPRPYLDLSNGRIAKAK